MHFFISHNHRMPNYNIASVVFSASIA